MFFLNSEIFRRIGCALLFGVASAGAAELLPNPSFEEGGANQATGWSLRAWEPFGAPRGTGRIVDNAACTGKRSFYARGVHPQSQVYMDRRNMPAEPGKRYHLSVSLRQRSAMRKGRCRIQFTFYDRFGKQLLAADPYLGSAHFDTVGCYEEWTRIGVAAKSPAGTRFISVTMRLVGIGEAWFDDISLAIDALPEERPAVSPAQSAQGELKKSDDGTYFVRLELRNPLSSAMRDIKLRAIGVQSGPLGEITVPKALAAEETRVFHIPVQFPKNFSSDAEWIQIRADYRYADRNGSAAFLLQSPVGDNRFETMIRENRWGVAPNPHRIEGGCMDLGGVVLMNDGKKAFFGSKEPAPLQESTQELGLILQVDSREAWRGDLLLRWEVLDYFCRPASGEFTFQLPSGNSAFLYAPLPKKQLARLKSLLLKNDIPHYRLNLKLLADGKVVSEKSIPAAFRKCAVLPKPPAPLAEHREDLPLYGNLKLVDEVLCGDPREDYRRREGGKGYGAKTTSEPLDYYGGSSVLNTQWRLDYRDKREVFTQVAEILGKNCRTASDWGWFSYYMGRNRVKPGKYYLLRVEYPDDVSRNTLVFNGFSPLTSIGFHTGSALGDPPTKQKFMQHFALPLSGRYQFHETIFQAQHANAWVGFHAPGAKTDPDARGVAIHAVRLYEIGDAAELEKKMPACREPDGLPRREIGYLNEDYLPDASDLLRYRFFGHNLFAPLLLMYGGGNYTNNSGQIRWNSKLFGPDGLRHPIARLNPEYYNRQPAFLERFITEPRNRGVAFYAVLEYAGTGRLPEEACAIDPDGNPVSYAWGVELDPRTGLARRRFMKDGRAIDMAHPAVGEDMALLAEELATVYGKRHTNFGGVIFTVRFQAWQIGYGQENLRRFAAEQHIRLPEKDAARWIATHHADAYRQWHYRQKRANFVRAAERLHRTAPNLKFMVLNYNGGDDNLHFGSPLFSQGHRRGDEFCVPGGIAFPNLKGTDLVSFMEDYRRPDIFALSVGMSPRLYRNDRLIWNIAPVHYPFMCADKSLWDAFRTGAGTAMCNWFIYNEDAGHNNPDTGWEAPGLNGNEPAGRFSMMEELMAMAAGDPSVIFTRIGKMSRGYPGVAREFAQAYRSLPALESTVLPTGSDPGITVRCYRSGDRCYLAVIYTAITLQPGMVRLKLPEYRTLRNLVTGQTIAARSGVFEFPVEHMSLNSFMAEK